MRGDFFMRIHIAGTDARAAYLAEALRKKGHEITSETPCDLMILALPRSDLPPFLPDEGQKIVCGKVTDDFRKIAGEKCWQLYPILEDEIFTQENARLTAEGALFYAMEQADFALEDANCTVIGYGRIGKALTKMLRDLGAKVRVAARRKESREEAGEGSVHTDDLPLLLPETDLLFNTVPSPLLKKDALSRLPSHALLIELASAPYGIDLSAAREMGLRAWLESTVPGRYCPKSAALAMERYLRRRDLL